MLDKNVIAIGIASLALFLLSVSPVQASSWQSWDHSRYSGKSHRHHYRHRHHHYRYHSYPRHGKIVVSLPGTYISLSVGKSRYYYCDGVYYRKHGFNYVVVEPPVGAVLKLPPPYYEPVMINGTVYYVNNGVYYRGTHSGYQVVESPSGAPVFETARVEPQFSNYAKDSFTVNVPNYTGHGYTAIVLKKSGDGFTGPQGEFYPAFPRVEDLRVMYAK